MLHSKAVRAPCGSAPHRAAHPRRRSRASGGIPVGAASWIRRLCLKLSALARRAELLTITGPRHTGIYKPSYCSERARMPLPRTDLACKRFQQGQSATIRCSRCRKIISNEQKSWSGHVSGMRVSQSESRVRLHGNSWTRRQSAGGEGADWCKHTSPQTDSRAVGARSVLCACRLR